MNQKFKIFLFFFIGAVLGMFVMYLVSNYTIQKKTETTELISNKDNFQNSKASFDTEEDNDQHANEYENTSNKDVQSSKINPYSKQDIDDLTDEDLVIDFVKKNHELPDYYLTKSEARSQGWVASKGNLCDVLPGKAIGGDKFSNREGQLPKGPQYFEADVNYNCGRRNADRIVFTKSGEVYLTKNHYKTFEKQ